MLNCLTIPSCRSLFLQQGFSFLEILLVLFILSIGLLGFTELQLFAMHNNLSAYQHTQAELTLDRLVEQLQITSKNYYSALFQTWRQQVAQELPTAQISISTTAAQIQLRLCWPDLSMQTKQACNETILIL